MRVLGLDISMRSTGACILLPNNKIVFKNIRSKKENYDDENLLNYVWDEIKTLIQDYIPTHIAIEGLSYDSISNSKDIIDGLHWYVRTRIKVEFPNIPVSIFEVTTWRNPLFDSVDRKLLTANKKELKTLKLLLKTVPDKKEKSEIVLANEQLILNCDIKYLTYIKLSDEIKTYIEEITKSKSKFDLCDAYNIASHYKTVLEK